MSWSYREKETLENYTIEREWGFATQESFETFVREHRLNPSIPTEESSIQVQVGEGKTPEDIDAGAVLKQEIDRMRREAKVAPPPRPPVILEEIRNANIDAIMKAEYLKTPEDWKWVREWIGINVYDFALEDFTEADALLILRPFGRGSQTSTFAICSVGEPSCEGGFIPARVFSVEEAATRTGPMKQVTVRFEDVINPAYLSQGSTAEEKELERLDGGSEPVL